MTSEERILQAAEARIRVHGYNGFSFRDIARDTGLTNAGVHHHFPTKTALVTRVAQDYAARFLEALDVPPEARVAQLRLLFERAVKTDGKMCLCGLLAAESRSLPEPVVAEAADFFKAIIERLSESFADHADPKSEATALLARLEGALLISQVTQDPDVFDMAMRAA